MSAPAPPPPVDAVLPPGPPPPATRDGRAFRVAVLYASPDSARHAADFAAQLAGGSCPGATLRPVFWPLDDIADPARRRAALADLVAADAVVVTSRSSPLDAATTAWLRDSVPAGCILIQLTASADGTWNITLRHAAGFSLGHVGTDPATVEIFPCGYRPPLRQSA